MEVVYIVETAIYTMERIMVKKADSIDKIPLPSLSKKSAIEKPNKTDKSILIGFKAKSFKTRFTKIIRIKPINPVYNAFL